MKTNNVIKSNIEKIKFFVENNPDLRVRDIAKKFSLPIIDLNVSFWKGEKTNQFKVDKDTGEIKVLRPFSEFELDDQELINLRSKIAFAIGVLNEEQTDIESNILNNYLIGYHTHDQEIAIQMLLNNNVISKYDIKDKKSKSTYTFYTLSMNRKYEWGRKQFKNVKKKDTKKIS